MLLVSLITPSSNQSNPRLCLFMRRYESAINFSASPNLSIKTLWMLSFSSIKVDMVHPMMLRAEPTSLCLLLIRWPLAYKYFSSFSAICRLTFGTSNCVKQLRESIFSIISSIPPSHFHLDISISFAI